MGSLDSSSFRHGHWAAPFSPCPSVSRSVRGGHVKSQEGLFLPPHRGLDPTDRGADPPAREERRRSSSSLSVGIELTCAPQIDLQPWRWNRRSRSEQSRRWIEPGGRWSPGWLETSPALTTPDSFRPREYTWTVRRVRMFGVWTLRGGHYAYTVRICMRTVYHSTLVAGTCRLQLPTAFRAPAQL